MAIYSDILNPMVNVSNAPERSNFSWFDMVRAMWFFLEEKRLNYAVWTLILFTIYFYQMLPALIISHIIDFFSKYHPGQPLNEFYFWAVFLGVSSGIVGLVRLTGKNKLGDLQSHARYIARTKGFERLVYFSIILPYKKRYCYYY